MRRLLLGVASLVLALGPLPALAAPVDPASGDTALAAIFAPAPDPAPGISPEAEGVASRPRVATKSTCTANCWDGSTVTCSGTSCSAVNSNCSSNQRGYCTGTTTGTKYCPVCPAQTCSAYTQCSPSGSRSCTGTSGDCFSVHNCYAYCDGNYYLCPSTPNVCPF